MVNQSPLSESELTTARESFAKSDQQFLRRQRENEHFRMELEKSLSSPSPETLTAIIGRLGLKTSYRLYRADRKSTRAIADRSRKLIGPKSGPRFDKASAQQVLIREIASKHPRTLCGVAVELGFAVGTVEQHFPELCKRLVRRRKHLHEQARAATVRKLTRALEKTPAPTMTELSARLGYPEETLKTWAPDVCRKIVERWSKSRKMESIRIHDGLKSMLSENPPPSTRSALRRLGTHYEYVKKHFPELLPALKERRCRYQAAVQQERMDGLVRLVQDIVNDFKIRGINPYKKDVAAKIPCQSQFGWFVINRTITQVLGAHYSEKMTSSSKSPAPQLSQGRKS